MSGSTKYDYGGERGGDTCSILEHVVVVSPKAAILATVKKDDVLDVAVISDRLVVVAPAGILGGLAFPRALKLKDCINQGFEYVAQVERIAGGLCEVEVRNK